MTGIRAGMTKPLVLLDCDGVLANFTRRWLDTVEELTGFRFPDESITEWQCEDSPFFDALAFDVGKSKKDLAKEVWKEVNRIGWCRDVPPYPEAIEAVAALREVADVEVVTAPFVSSVHWVKERYEWLRAHFGIGFRDVHFTHKKHRLPGAIFVDDKTAHVEEWALAHPASRAMLWSQPYNHRDTGADGFRARSWGDVHAAAREAVRP